MNLFAVSARNLRVRLLSTVLTTVSIAVGTALLAALWLLMAELDRGYKASIGGYRAVVASKDSSPIEIVTSTVLNIGFPQGVVPLSTYLDLHENRLPRRYHVRYAIPQARGDTYQGFPIVGTTDELFTEFEVGGRDEHLRFAAGRRWQFGHGDLLEFAERKAELAAHMAEHAENGGGHEGHDHEIEVPEAWREVVVGATVARRLGLSVDDVIVPVHGREDEIGAHSHDDFASEVVGVLEATNSPLDRAIYLPLGTFLSMDEHVALRETEGAEPGDVLLSAIVAKPVHRLGDRYLELYFQTRPDAQVAVPAKVIPQLMQMVAQAQDVLEVVSWLVLVVAGVSILVSLYNTMNERRREIAIMRSLGARRMQIVRVILQEATAVSLLGAVLGVLAAHVAALALRGTVEDVAGVAVDWTRFSAAEGWLILGVGALGGLAGLLPAIKGSTTEVADHLGPVS